MTEIHPLPSTGENAAQSAARVSTKCGWWSVVLALGSALVFMVGGFAIIFALGSMFGNYRNPDYQTAGGVATFVIYAVMIGMLVASVVLGVMSIVSASRQPVRPGRTAAILLGCIGIVLSALIGLYLSLPLLVPLLRG